MMFMTLIFTITSITSAHLKRKKFYKARHYGSTDDLPQEEPIFNNDHNHCVLELFDDDYAFRTQNRFASCKLEKHWQQINKDTPSFYTYSTCSNLISMSYDMKDDLKKVKSFDCDCTLDWGSPPKKHEERDKIFYSPDENADKNLPRDKVVDRFRKS